MGDVLVGLAIRVVTPRQKLIEILELYNTFIILILHLNDTYIYWNMSFISIYFRTI